MLSIVSAGSDARVAYLAYRSGDAGDHWERTGLPEMEMKPNDDSSKLSGERAVLHDGLLACRLRASVGYILAGSTRTTISLVPRYD